MHFILYAMPLAMALGYLCIGVTPFAIPACRNAREALLRAAMAAPLTLACALLVHNFSLAPPGALQIVALGVLAMLVAGAMVLLVPITLTSINQAALWCVLAIVAGGAWSGLHEPAWQHTSITHDPNTVIELRWMQSGEYLTNWVNSDHSIPVYNWPALSKRDYSSSAKGGTVYWLDENYLVFTITNSYGNDPSVQLKAYDFSTNQEIEVATGKSLSVIFQCVRDHQLVWLETGENSRPILHQMDLRNGDRRIHEGIFPDGDAITWRSPRWLADGRIGVWGTDAASCNVTVLNDDVPLSMDAASDDPDKGHDKAYSLFIEPLTSNTQLYSSDSKGANWRPSPDLTKAFTRYYADDAKNTMRCVNLITNQSVSIADGKWPVWRPDSQTAYRQRSHKGQDWIVRFDAKTMTENPIQPALADSQLVGVSASGKFALFVDSEMFYRTRYTLVALDSGRSHIIYGSFALGTGHYFFDTHLSLFSPDERNFVIGGFSMSSPAIQSTVYTIPPDWQ